jgi:hypothetical protein
MQVFISGWTFPALRSSFFSAMSEGAKHSVTELSEVVALDRKDLNPESLAIYRKKIVDRDYFLILKE